ncbi:MAG TPA: hypothetical protein VGO50_14870 [Pyrinomonadaceae bacterium]|jgi:hypothetical protein|nr:hypothetical protein [Pyrinomonadaceae bacterium]
MHCPDCGQQQISDEIRFCSRCGFPLSAVSQVLANRGTIPGLSETSDKPRWLTRKKGIFFGVVWMLFFLLMIAGLLDELKVPGEIVSAAAIFGVFSGIVIIVASAMFLGREHRAYPDTSHDPYGQSGVGRYEMGSQRPAQSLPPQQSTPVQNYAQPGTKNRWDTNELVQPSVTEGTTKLLKNEKES